MSAYSCFYIFLQLFAYWEILYAFCLLLFFSINFCKKILSGIPSESNSLDPDQAQHFVRPDLGPDCLQRLSADNPSKPKVKGFYIFWPIFISLGKGVTEVGIICQAILQIKKKKKKKKKKNDMTKFIVCYNKS